MAAMPMSPAMSKPYVHTNLPSIGETIVFRGLNGARLMGTVTSLKHIPTEGAADRWGVFVEIESGEPAYINDYRVIVVTY